MIVFLAVLTVTTTTICCAYTLWVAVAALRFALLNRKLRAAMDRHPAGRRLDGDR